MDAVTLENRIVASGMPMNLGDINGDGITSQVQGNVIRSQAPSVLLPNDTSLPEGGGGLQTIETLMAYNDKGKMTYSVDPEGNVTDLIYYPETAPNGVDVSSTPADGRTLNSTTGGYLKSVIRDSRILATGPVRRETTAPVQLETSFIKDAVGNTTRTRDPRGIESPASRQGERLPMPIRA